MGIVGEGKDLSWFIKEVHKNKLTPNVELLGYRDDVQKLLLSSKILVLPTKNEGMPNVVLEAGACGVPTISSSFMGADEVIRNGIDGFIVGDTKEMVDKSLLLLTNERLRVKMGNRMQTQVRQKFSMENQKSFISFLINRFVEGSCGELYV